MTFQEPKTRRIDPSAFRRSTILVAEGDRGLRRTLRDVLLGMGFPSIVLASNSAETMRQIVEQRPSVVLLDHKLPGSGAAGGDGLTLTRRLRRENDPLPIILMATAPDAALVAAARDVGVNEIVRKPLSMESLVLRLMHVLQVPRKFIRSPGFLGPDRRRLVDRRRTERRAETALPAEQERRQRPSRRSGDERRKPPKSA
jgi:two-component system chemotaxis response regulator CheY